MTRRLLHIFLIDERFGRLTMWIVNRAKHYSETMNLCFLFFEEDKEHSYFQHAGLHICSYI